MADGADHIEPAPGRGGAGWRRAGAALAAIACLGSAAASGWGLWPAAREGYRKAFVYQRTAAQVSAVELPREEADDAGRATRGAGRATYEFVLGERLFGGEWTQPPRKHTTGYEPDLAGLEAGAEIPVYYDPAEPEKNTLEPIPDIRLAVAGMLILPVLAWGFLFAARAARPSTVPATAPAIGPASKPAGAKGGYRSRAATLFCAACSAMSLACAAGVHIAAPFLPWRKAWLLAAGLAAAAIFASAIAAWAPRDALAARRPARRLPRATPRIWIAPVLVVGGLAVAAMSAYLAGRDAWRVWEAAGQFRKAAGTAMATRVDEITPGPNMPPQRRYRPIVRFFYRVGAAEYAREDVPPSGADFVYPDDADAVLKKYPRNLPIVVYYNPSEPSAGLLAAPQPVAWPQWLILAPLVVSTGLLAAGWGASLPLRVRQSRRFLDLPADAPWRVPSLGVWRECPEGLELHRGRSPVAAAWLGWAAVACVLFAAATWRQRTAGETMSTSGIVYGVISCLSAAAACGLLAWRRTRVRLILDTRERVLTAGNDRRAFTLPFDELDAWTVSLGGANQLEEQAGDTPRARHIGSPILAVRTREGREAALHVFTGPASLPLRLAVARKTAGELAKITGCAV
jgi:hypothetical protein